MQTDSIVHADIFFFITAIAVIIVTLIIIVILFYFARVARNLAEISDDVKKESGHVLREIENIRERVKEQGIKFSSLINVFLRFFGVKSKDEKAEKKKPTRKIKVEDSN